MSDVIRASKFLLEEDAPALPPSARPSIQRLKDHSHPPKVGGCVGITWYVKRKAWRVATVDVYDQGHRRGCNQIVHRYGCILPTIDPRILAMPGRSTPDFDGSCHTRLLLALVI